MSGRFDADRAGFSLAQLERQVERNQAINLLVSILSQPRFDAAVLEREKARVVASLEEAATKPESIGEKAFQAALYGDHPYGLSKAVKSMSVQWLTQDDLAAFYRVITAPET
jgi:zinc protease